METALAVMADGQGTLAPLDEQEERDLTMYEEVIGKGLQSFIDVGRALQAVRDGRLHRAEYKTFEDYCFERWHLGRAHANRYIDASAVARILSPIGDIPTKESQVRPLTRVRDADGKLDQKMIVKLWRRAVDMASGDVRTGKRVTAKVVETVVAPLIKRRKREEVIERFRRHTSSGRGIAKDAAVPIRMVGGMIPTVTLQLPMNNPQATVGAMASNFDLAYIEAVVDGLQRYLKNGHVDSMFEPPPEVMADLAISTTLTPDGRGNPE